jgi:hypothetical protein
LFNFQGPSLSIFSAFMRVFSLLTVSRFLPSLSSA